MTTVVLVARPQTSALREAERTRAELSELGVTNISLAMNGVFEAVRSGDAIADAMTGQAKLAISKIPAGLAGLARSQTPFLPKGTTGLAALQAMIAGGAVLSPEASQPRANCALPHGLAPLVDDLARAGHGVIMTMGKGGVGKTAVAAAIAVALARRGHPVVLSTTDPAAHVASAIGESVANLTVARIDPVAEIARYRDEILAKVGGTLDVAGRAMLEEDLRSPCTEEIAVFRAFARTVDAGQKQFVVLDTAPTGHTILLLDAAEAYHREVLRTQADMPEAVRELLPRLRDPELCHCIIVTLAEATPVHEAERLQADLARAGIKPYAWVINQSLLASGTKDPLLAERGHYELPFIRRVADELAPRCALIAWKAVPPVGEAGLLNLLH
jgi:arsenite-transporting ATPase